MGHRPEYLKLNSEHPCVHLDAFSTGLKEAKIEHFKKICFCTPSKTEINGSITPDAFEFDRVALFLHTFAIHNRWLWRDMYNIE